MGEEHIEHRPGDIARRSLRRLEMHAEAGRGIDLDHPAPGLVHRTGHVGGNEVDPGNVEADHLRRAPGDIDIVRMDHIRAVDRRSSGRQVGGRPQDHIPAPLGNAVQAQSLQLDMVEQFGIDPDAGHHSLMAVAAARVAIHGFDELRDRRDAVAGHAGRHAPGHGDHLAVDDEDAMIGALEKLLDDHAPAVAGGGRETEAQLVGGADAGGDAAAVIAVDRLGDERKTESFRHGFGLFGAAHHLAARHGDAAFAEQLLGCVLVAGQLDRNQWRAAGDRRAQPLLLHAITELDEALVVEPQDRNAAALRLVDQ